MTFSRMLKNLKLTQHCLLFQVFVSVFNFGLIILYCLSQLKLPKLHKPHKTKNSFFSFFSSAKLGPKHSKTLSLSGEASSSYLPPSTLPTHPPTSFPSSSSYFYSRIFRVFSLLSSPISKPLTLLSSALSHFHHVLTVQQAQR